MGSPVRGRCVRPRSGVGDEVMTEEERRRVGRPSTGERIQVRIPHAILEAIDAEADFLDTTRAAVIRDILEGWADFDPEAPWGPQGPQ